MCRSLRDGGQRCYGHARKAFDKAFLAYSAACEAGNPAAITHTLTKATKAGVALATTVEGAEALRLRSAAAMAIDRPDRAGWYDSMLRQGQMQREASAAVQTAVRTHMSAAQAASRLAASGSGKVRALAEHLHLH